jgi:hypothetical protein
LIVDQYLFDDYYTKRLIESFNYFELKLDCQAKLRDVGWGLVDARTFAHWFYHL